MTQSQELYNKAKEDGTIVHNEYLKFKGAGKHTLKFIKDEEFDGTNYRTKKEERKMRYTFEEDGATKLYETAIFKKDEQGDETKELSNFVLQMNPYGYGDTIEALYKPIEGTYKGFIKVSSTNTPLTDVIDEDDYSPDPDPEDM